MDVKFINPFLNGALEVIRTMAFMEAVAAKPYLKKDDTARGDVSGIIGITGDATGSLAISFSEDCICGIVGSMLGETCSETTKEVLDAAGELTNMISGVARTNLEKMGLQVYAAIPSVVFGKNHTLRHILNSPSIVIPFSTDKGNFFVDVCIRTTDARARSRETYQVVNRRTADLFAPLSPKNAAEPAPGPIVTEAAALNSGSEKGEQVQDAKSRRERLKETLDAMIEDRRNTQKLLSAQPFMSREERKKLNGKIARYDRKIRQLKLDLTALEILSKLSIDDLDSPVIKKNHQNC